MSFVLLVPRNWSLFAEILISFCWGRIHQRSLCCSYDSCLSALGRERGIFLSSFSTRQSSEGAQISAESPRTGKTQGAAFPLPWKDCWVKFPVLQWREPGQCFRTGTLGISNTAQAINLPSSSAISSPYQDGVQTLLIWLQDRFTLCRVPVFPQANVSLFSDYTKVGFFLVVRSGKLLQPCTGGCSRQHRRGGTGTGTEVLEAAHTSRA